MTEPQPPHPSNPYRTPSDDLLPGASTTWDAPASSEVERRRRRRTTAITIGAWAVAGTVVFGSAQLGWGPLGGLGGIVGFGGDRATRTTEVTEAFESVQVTSSNVDVAVRYDDVPTARIVETDLAQGGLTHRVEDGKLVIAHTGGGGWRWFSDEGLTVVLPRSLEASTPDVAVSATTASIDVRGGFGAVDLQAQTGSVQAEGSYERFAARTTTGSIDLRGTAAEVTADAHTGSVDLQATGAQVIRASTTTGSLDIEADGVQPREVTARASTGSVDIKVPEGSYAVQSRSGTGSSDVEVAQDANSPHRITVETNTGSIDVTD